MKKIFFIIVFVSAICGGGWGQAGNESTLRQSVMKVPVAEMDMLKTGEYKSTQASMEEIVKAEPLNEDAWLNLYKASRYSNFSDHSDKINSESQKKLDDVLARMNNAIPDSYAWNYCSFINGNRNDNAIAYLKKAYALRPNETELWDDMLAEAVIAADPASVKSFAEKLSAASIYTDAEMEYSRNVLSSVEKDGILITNGSLDTYPVILFQQVHNFRNDVKVVCLDWCGSERYVKTLKGIFNTKKDKLQTGQPYSNLSHILLANGDKNIYLALTIPPDILKEHVSNLYCTGLAMKYSKKALQNLNSLVYNWENLFQVNNIRKSEEINKNYLLPLILLKDYYASVGNTIKQQELMKLAEETAVLFGVKEKISKQLD